MAYSRMIHPTIECFIQKDGKYLMLHRSPNKKIMPDVWMAPGGHVEFNEGLFECTRREVLEETGLSIKNIKVKAVGTAYAKDIQSEFHFHLLVADYDSGELKSSIDDGTFVWLTIDEIKKLDNLLAELHNILHYLFDGSDKVVSYKAVYDSGNHMTDFTFEER